MVDYCVGIDLGTTNSAVAYAASEDGRVQNLLTLPSCIFFDEKNEEVVGEQARSLGAKTPTRFIHSAKSWLSNPAAARQEAILPETAGKLSPVEASARYLATIRSSWKHGFLDDQEVVITIPASFDEVARKLTLEAAKMAGLPNVILLEEPQAAFYSWLLDHNTPLNHGEVIVVCDVGGGTTDFSLIEVGESGFMRMAVGNHLLLGGDNMDHALAHAMGQKANIELDSHQWLTLLHEARIAKEKLLQNESKHTVWLASGGSKIVGGGVSITLTSSDVRQILVDGFFPLLPFNEAAQIARGSGIKAMGLPFESEAAITKHLAAFLQKSGKTPTHILFNGGAFKPKQFQKRVIDSLELWFGQEIKQLKNQSLDLSVSRGAVYFARARQGAGTRIKSGSARAYYLKIKKDNKEHALTILPRGANEGQRYTSDHIYTLLSNQPVSFELFHSHTRLDDKQGLLLPIDTDQMLALPPLKTLLKYGKQQEVPVALHIELTEIGTIELWLKSQNSEHKWLLEFSTEHQVERAHETFDTTYLDQAKQMILNAFSVGTAKELKSLIAQLEKHVELPKAEWSLAILRGLFEALVSQSHKRDLAPHFAERFWNLAGFLLRPGIGYPLDEHRISQLWKLILADDKKDMEIHKWICYRRIAAGLSKGQQTQLFNALYPTLFKLKREKYAYTEKLRAFASFELIDTSHKVKLGNALLNRIEEGKGDAVDFWALGRLGARHLMHGTIANVVPKKVCEDWATRLLATAWYNEKHAPFALALLTRKTDSHTLNVSEKLISQVKVRIGEDLTTLVDQQRELSSGEKARIFGESLPVGLIY